MNKLKIYWHLPASLLLFLICFYAGAKGIGDNALAFDEPFSVFHAQLSIKAIITELSKGNNPPLYEILLHFWIKFFGISEFSVRLLSDFFMSISAIVIFQIGRLFSSKIAWLAGILFIFSNYQTAFASEARVYALFVLLTSISMLSFSNLVIGNKHKYWPMILIISNILLVYSHFFGFFVWFLQLSGILIIKEIRVNYFKRYLKYAGISMVFYLPYSYIFITRLFDSVIHGTYIAPVSNLHELHNIIFFLTNRSLALYILSLVIIWISVQRFIFKTQENIYVKYTLVFISIFLLVFSLSIPGAMPFYYFMFCTKYFVLILYLFLLTLLTILAITSTYLSALFKIVFIWFLLPILAMFIVSIWIPMFLDRYVIYTLPAFYLLLSIAVFQFENEIQYALSVLLVTLMIVTSVRNVENNRDVKGLVSKIKNIKDESSIVYMCPDYFDLNFTYYYNPVYFKNVNNIYPISSLRAQLSADKIYTITSYKDIDTTLFNKVDKIIYLDAAADFSYRNNRISEFLKARFGNGNIYEYKNIFQLYEFKTIRK